MRWRNDRFVTIKVFADKHHPPGKCSGENELHAHREVSKWRPWATGWHHVRKLQDSFALRTKHGYHQCLVFEPLGETVLDYRDRSCGETVPSFALKLMVSTILDGLVYLHSTCRLIHTGKETLILLQKLSPSASPALNRTLCLHLEQI